MLLLVWTFVIFIAQKPDCRMLLNGFTALGNSKISNVLGFELVKFRISNRSWKLYPQLPTSFFSLEQTCDGRRLASDAIRATLVNSSVPPNAEFSLNWQTKWLLSRIFSKWCQRRGCKAGFAAKIRRPGEPSDLLTQLLLLFMQIENCVETDGVMKSDWS